MEMDTIGVIIEGDSLISHVLHDEDWDGQAVELVDSSK
jgi:hypothetical protein